MHVNSGETKHFTCEHINMTVDDTNPPIKQLHITADEMSDYPCSSAVQEKLQSSIRYANVNGFAPVVQITQTKYAIYAGATASNPLGFCHLEVTGESMSCSGKDCRGFMARGKHKRIKSNCIHMYMYFLATKKRVTENDDEIQKHEEQTADKEVYEAPITVNANEAHQKVSSPRECTIDVALTRQLPYEIDKEKIQKILMYDINTKSVSPDCWPNVFVPDDSACQRCGSPLSLPKPHPGTKGACYLISELNPFNIIDIKIKTCSNSSCQAMHQAVPFDLGK